MIKRTAIIALKIQFIFATLLILNVKTSLAGIDTWTTDGPYGVRFSKLIIDPNNPNTIYAFTFDCENIGLTSIVYKSIDGGNTWFASGNGIPTTDCGNPRWSPMVMDPEDSNIFYVANDEGLYKTTNGGQFWVQVTNMRIASVAISPHGTLYTGVYDFRGYQDGIYRSYDGGTTWELLRTGLPSQPDVASNLVVAPNAQHIIYASFQLGGLYKSIDGGDSWQSINSGFLSTPHVYVLAVDPYDSQVVYFSEASGLGLFRSDNGGASWQPIGEGIPAEIYAFEIDPGNQQVIYAGTVSGVYRSLDNLGENWGAFSEGMGNRIIYGLAIDHQDPQNMYAGSQAGIWKRTLVNLEPEDFSVSINNGALYTNQDTVTLNFTAPPGTDQVLISNDGGFAGASWQSYSTSKPWTLETYGIYVLPRTVYVKFKHEGTTTGLYQDDIIYDPNAPSGSVTVTETLVTQSNIFDPQGIQLTSTYTYTLFLPSVMNNARAGYELVTLLLAATDDLSGVDSVIISHTADFSASQWETFETIKNYWLPTDGSRTIFVKFRDRAGNVSTVYSVTAP